MRAFFNTAKPVWVENEETQKHVTFGLYTYINKTNEDAKLSIATSGVYRVFVNGEFFYTGPARCAHDYFRVDQISIPTKERDCHVAIELVNYYVASFCYLRQAGFVQAEIAIGKHVFAATGIEGFSAVRLKERVKKVQRYSFQRPFTESYRLVPGVYGWHFGNRGKNTEDVRLCITSEKKLVERNILPYTFPRSSVAKCIAKGLVKPKESPIDYFRDRGLTDVSEQAGSLLEGYEEANLEQHISDEVQEWDFVFKETVPEAYTGETSFKTGQFVTYEFPCDKTGFLSMNIECQAEAQVYLLFDEILMQDDVNPFRMPCYNVVRLDVLPGEYRFQTMEPYGMRYLKIVVNSGQCVIRNIGMREMICPQPIIREYTGNDPELQRIYNAAKESFLQNSCDIFMDCPTRERAGWLCDSYFLAKTEFYLTGKNAIERNFLENYLLPEEFRDVPKGMVPMCYPADHLDGNFIPNWAMWLILELSEFTERTGDTEFVEKFKQRVYGIVNWFVQYENTSGLLERLPKWNFIEWSMSNKLVRDVGFAGNMLYAFMLEKVGELYADDACIKKAQTLKETIRQRSYTGRFFCDNEVYQDGKLVQSGQCTETCQYYAFFTGVATQELYPELWQIITDQFGPDRMKKGVLPEIHPSNAFIGNYLRMILLNRYGKRKQMLEELKGYFLYMADTTGTLWEMKDEVGSCNHGFASYAAVLIGKEL